MKSVFKYGMQGALSSQQTSSSILMAYSDFTLSDL